MKNNSELQVLSNEDVQKPPVVEALFEEFSIVELEDRLEFLAGRCNISCGSN